VAPGKKLHASPGACPPGRLAVAATPGARQAVYLTTRKVSLLELRERAELVWATTWGDGANDIMGLLLGLPPLPVAKHSRPKSPGLLAYAGDDHVSPMDALRIELRAEHIPTSLILVDPCVGLTTADLSGRRIHCGVNEKS